MNTHRQSARVLTWVYRLSLLRQHRYEKEQAEEKTLHKGSGSAAFESARPRLARGQLRRWHVPRRGIRGVGQVVVGVRAAPILIAATFEPYKYIDDRKSLAQRRLPMPLKRRQFTKGFKLQVVREVEAGKRVAQAALIVFLSPLGYDVLVGLL